MLKHLSYSAFLLLLALAFTAPAQAALSVNAGSQTKNVSTGTTITPTTGITANAGDIMVSDVAINGSATAVTVIGVSGCGVTWAKRSSVAMVDTFSNHDDLEVWWAYTASSQAACAPVVTVSSNISVGAGNMGARFFSVTGFTGGTYSTAPWDTASWNAAFSGSSTSGSSSTVTVTGFSTTNTATMMLGFYSADSAVTQTAGAGYTLVGTPFNGNPSEAAQEQVVASPQGSASMSFGTISATWLMISDALSQTGSGAGGSAAQSRLLLGVGQ